MRRSEPSDQRDGSAATNPPWITASPFWFFAKSSPSIRF